MEAIDKCGHETQLFGALWEELELKHATIHREIPFNLTFTVFAKSKISVNIQPNFKAGSHDRVFSAQLNGAVSLTDPTTLLRKEYSHGTNILFYDLDNVDAETKLLDDSLANLDMLKKIAQPDDIVLIAGKGHEDYQILKDKTIHFDDREEVKKVFG